MYFIKNIVFVLALLIWPLSLSAKTNNNTFKSGEKVVYDAYYNWGFIWLNAGEVSFTVQDSSYKDQPAYHIKALGRTHDKYDGFFKVRDTFEILAQPDSLISFYYKQATYEGPTELVVEYHADIDSQKFVATRWQPNKPEKKIRKDTFDIYDNSFDMLSAIYGVRNFDFTKYKKGDIIPFKLWLDMKYYDIYVRYRGIEDIKLKDGTEYNCLVFTPLLVEGSIFKDGEGMKVYVTNDRNRVPVYIEAKILVGKVKAILKHTENLKYPTEALIRK